MTEEAPRLDEPRTARSNPSRSKQSVHTAMSSGAGSLQKRQVEVQSFAQVYPAVQNWLHNDNPLFEFAESRMGLKVDREKVCCCVFCSFNPIILPHSTDLLRRVWTPGALPDCWPRQWTALQPDRLRVSRISIGDRHPDRGKRWVLCFAHAQSNQIFPPFADDDTQWLGAFVVVCLAQQNSIPLDFQSTGQPSPPSRCWTSSQSKSTV